MPLHRDDAGIPTLTERAEPALAPAAGAAGDPFPVLTEQVSAAPRPAPEPVAPPPDASVLAARLQAEVEALMQQALADAVEQIQARMDAELPAIVARVMQGTRRG
ncbi:MULTISPECIES: hypothetical protein [unclassified Achromobacter]|uniref:hypothetical protein n=1 Tax=unclassified Achromobacter TaxID=2626865 RepID=UPI00069E9EC9|nr:MULTISPECIES: hypothetical protein [unclassified Achromobacter]KOF54245.1 hypothetical protein AD428_08205 [Achromobacter sp. DMS1]